MAVLRPLARPLARPLLPLATPLLSVARLPVLRRSTRRLQAVRSTAEAAVFRTAMNLPVGLQRRLAGAPVEVDGQTLAVETQLVLRLKRLSGVPDPDRLPMPEGRAALRAQTTIAGGAQPIGAVRDLAVGDLPGRLYVPTGADGELVEPGALLVFFHGGGFMHGDLDSHDAACRFLAEHAGVRVLAVDYRLAPEHRFPAAHDDALAAYAWVREHAHELGADPDRLGVGGDSAGGNLAAATAVEAARRGWPCELQLLVYPATDGHGRDAYRSPELFGEGFYLSTHYMALADDCYTPDPAVLADPRMSPMTMKTVPDGLAPALVVTAGFDPLRDEGEAYARKLAEAGVEVELIRYPDQIHGFFNVVGAGRASRAVNAEIAAKTGAALRP